MSTILHIIVYIPLAIAIGYYGYRYRAKLIEVKDRISARLNSLR